MFYGIPSESKVDQWEYWTKIQRASGVLIKEKISESMAPHHEQLPQKTIKDHAFVPVNIKDDLKNIISSLEGSTDDEALSRELCKLEIPGYWKQKKLSYHPLLGLGPLKDDK